ncbi:MULTISPECIES: protein phosphatase 2C domain-containing protein [unclassified Streptomyces]|uniref:protein phosphatase 2C domain-containing protein n=1 Tax=unclassified Streptomyces TaxID=2593676 RepID=UPI003828D3A9
MTQHGDSWWDELYDESAPVTAPTVPGDTLDDHFATTPRAAPTIPGTPTTQGTPTTPGTPAAPPIAGPGQVPDQSTDRRTDPDADRETAPARSAAPETAQDPAPGRSTGPGLNTAADTVRETTPDPSTTPSTTPSAIPVTAHGAAPGPAAAQGTAPAPDPGAAPGAVPHRTPPEPVAPPEPRDPRAEPPAPPPLREAHPPPPAPATPPLPAAPAPWEAPRTGPRTFPGPPPPPPVEAPTVQIHLPAPGGEPPGAEPDLTVQVAVPRPRTGFVGGRPPTYEAEPTALPVARPGELGELVADTVLDGARYGTSTLRAASVRGDSARYRGEPRRDALLTARFGHDETALVLVAVAAGSRAAEDAHLAAADACRWIAEAVCRSHARLSADIRSGRRGELKSGLHRLTDRTYGKLRSRAAERGLAPDEYTATLRCLLVPADPTCRTRVFFGIGSGGLFRLRDGVWQDIEPLLPKPAAVTGAPVVGFGSPPRPATETPTGATPETGEEGDRFTMDLGITTAPGPLVEEPVPPPAEPFRFRASVARPGDTLLLASSGLAEPIRGEPALARELADRWADPEPPGLAAFLADTQLRVTGYADDRTGVGVWEA